MNHQNQYSHLTAKEREFLSFPARQLLNKGLLKGETLDFGCGLGRDVEVLSEKGIKIYGYDKHYFPDFPQKKFDTIICLYVLNVLLPEEQARVLMEVSSLLNPDGKAYFAVRRDIVYEGYRMHKIHQKKTFQCKVVLPFKSIFKNESCEIYEWTPIHKLTKEVIKDCLFCKLDANVELITESATAFAILDKYPVNPGHTLIIPKRHVFDYFDLTFREQSACVFMINFVKELLIKRHNPDGFNIGINVGKCAGQTIPHAHIHLIPRYHQDMKNPEGGVRGVIPEKMKYH